ncbi:P-loop containing nucleoside triphosphate hydrolase protein [Mycena galericulata]|nr:P-loop containing nucleoside triphosphate hydrolase protein [Mycena galericulata]
MLLEPEFWILGEPCSATTSTTLSLVQALEDARQASAGPTMLLVNSFEGQSAPHSRVPPGDDVYDALGGAALEDSVALLSWLVLNVEPLSAWFILYIPAPAASPAPAPRTPTLPHTHRSVSDEGAPSGGGPVHGRDAHAGTAGAGQTDYVDAVLRTFFQIHVDQTPGDVLIFFPGREDIESLRKAIELLARQLRGAHCTMCVTFQGAQTNRVYAAAPRGACKCIVVVVTNIAETSVTIPGVRYVVDMGKSKEKRYFAGGTAGRFDALLTRDIVQPNALQRAERAGREGRARNLALHPRAGDAVAALLRAGHPGARAHGHA